MNRTRVPGKRKGDILIYALSTCVWCRKAKQILNEMGVEYDFVDVDQTSGDEKESIMNALKKHNPACSFPTIVINDTCIVGYKEDRIKEALNK
jgi:glutaredoxin-like protein NrdH